MRLRFQVHTKIRRPIHEVFDAIRNPSKLSKYFTDGGASGPLEEGKTVQWSFREPPTPAFPVYVKKVVEDKLIVFQWDVMDDLKTTVEIVFEPIGPKETLVKISEGDWRETEKDLENSYSNCMGWGQMLSCLKAYAEYGINLRAGAY
ncbi:SRPBCC domain-containing protein [Candidatus Bathyarchaeota archaeon]|nr:SRPBCC domain-containing protein [Candidatus Bathyarchaeota archaeon]